MINGKNAQLKEFIDLGKAVTDRFLEVFSAVLAIPPESEDYLTKLYSHTNDCGSHVRLLKCPPKPKDAKVSLQPQYVYTALQNPGFLSLESEPRDHLKHPYTSNYEN